LPLDNEIANLPPTELDEVAAAKTSEASQFHRAHDLGRSVLRERSKVALGPDLIRAVGLIEMANPGRVVGFDHAAICREGQDARENLHATSEALGIETWLAIPH
jgi:hypothetical protein